jgi:hypothetical protein
MNKFLKQLFCIHAWHIVSSLILPVDNMHVIVWQCYWCNKEKTEHNKK